MRLTINLRSVHVCDAGQHAAWQLKSADLTVASLGDLTTYNMRRLFANVGQGNSNPGPSTVARFSPLSGLSWFALNCMYLTDWRVQGTRGTSQSLSWSWS